MDRTIVTADEYFRKVDRWRDEVKTLRTIILDSPLTEELKWATPCYTFQKHNVVLINRFKDYCALAFFKGALLNDPDGILVKPGANTRAARIVKFTSVGEIVEKEPVLKAYIRAAIELERAGLKVDFSENRVLEFPEELKNKFEEDPDLAAAFHALTPGRQRAYTLYFSAPKQSKTRDSRIEKYVPRILDGKGMNDR